MVILIVECRNKVRAAHLVDELRALEVDLRELHALEDLLERVAVLLLEPDALEAEALVPRPAQVADQLRASQMEKRCC